VIGPKRTTRWWFGPGLNQVDIDVSVAGEQRRYYAARPTTPPPAPPDWRERLKRSLTGGP